MSVDRCEQDIYDNGVCVGMIVNKKKDEIERIVQLIASETGQPTDWNYAMGRAMVRTTGDVELVKGKLVEYGGYLWE